jgi:hypothetical protein
MRMVVSFLMVVLVVVVRRDEQRHYGTGRGEGGVGINQLAA